VPYISFLTSLQVDTTLGIQKINVIRNKKKYNKKYLGGRKLFSTFNKFDLAE